MSVEEKLRILSDRIKSHSSAMLTEEAVKTAIVLPFLNALEYDVFNPSEVVPEFISDAVGKKGEKVDYALKVADEIRILVECKPITTNLEKVHLAQLYRYFSVTSAKFAILTNGRTFNFYTDLEAPNKLDEWPFLSFDLSDLQSHLITELKKFSKNEFDVDGVLASARKLKYVSAIKKEMNNLLDNPSEEFVRMITSNLQLGRFTASVREEFTPMVKLAFREIVRDTVQTRLSTALAENESTVSSDVEGPPGVEIETTDEEREGYLIVRAIVRDIVKATRVTMRDQKSYCGVLIDNNNRKPLIRLHFNRSIKYIGLFDNEREDRLRIDSLDEIYDYSDRIRATANAYAEGKSLRQAPLKED